MPLRPNGHGDSLTEERAARAVAGQMVLGTVPTFRRTPRAVKLFFAHMKSVTGSYSRMKCATRSYTSRKCLASGRRKVWPANRSWLIGQERGHASHLVG